MAITHLTNASPGAPTLTGAIGSLIALLDFCLVTTLGWTKAQSGTNLATYISPTGGGYYVAVNDTTATTARVRGFETVQTPGTDVGCGTGPFPTDTQLSGGLYLYKGADTTTAREWRFVSDGSLFYLSIAANANFSLFTFGKFKSNKVSDLYNTVIMGDTAATTITAGVSAVILATSAGVAGSYLVRGYTGLGGAKQCSKAVDAGFGHTTGALGTDAGNTYPSAIEGGLILSRVQIAEGAGSFRGVLPGLWSPCHARPLGNGDTFTGTGDLSGKSFVAQNVSTAGQVLFETSDTWES